MGPLPPYHYKEARVKYMLPMLLPPSLHPTMQYATSQVNTIKSKATNVSAACAFAPLPPGTVTIISKFNVYGKVSTEGNLLKAIYLK